MSALHARLQVLPADQIQNIEIAPGCFWGDSVWFFPIRVAGMRKQVFSIQWAFEVSPDVLLTNPIYAELLDAWKRVIWALFTEPGDGHQRSYNTCGKITTSLRSLIPWMIATYRLDLSHLNPDALKEYVAYLEDKYRDSEVEDLDPDIAQGITAEAFAPYLSIWTYAYWARHVLAEAGVPHPSDEDPLVGEAAITIARRICRKMLQETKEIPDPVFISALNMAETTLDAPWLESLIDTNNSMVGKPADDMSAIAQKFISRHCEHLFETTSYATKSVRTLITDVRTACSVIIQGCTGIRVSELCGIESSGYDFQRLLPSCISIERSFDDEYEIFHLKAKLFKGTATPETVTWVLGMRPTGGNNLPLPVRAIDTLYRLDKGWRDYEGTHRLLVIFTGAGGNIPTGDHPVSPMSSAKVGGWQKRWLQETGCIVGQSEISTHRWRKTFARWMIRVSAGLLPALSHHFKHMSVAMTEVGYCQPNPEIAEMISDARVEDAGLLILGSITGKKPVRGPVADELEAFATELGRRFANRPPSDMHRDLSEEIRTRNIQLYSGEFGHCVFRGDGARCHLLADNPILPVLRLAPALGNQIADVCSECKNFCVSEDHRTFWENRLRNFSERLTACGSDTPPGIRSMLSSRIKQCKTVLGWMGGLNGQAKDL